MCQANAAAKSLQSCLTLCDPRDGSPPGFPIPQGRWGEGLVAQMVKNLPAKQETGVRSLGREDPLKKEMATHSSILA